MLNFEIVWHTCHRNMYVINILLRRIIKKYEKEGSGANGGSDENNDDDDDDGDKISIIV